MVCVYVCLNGISKRNKNELAKFYIHYQIDAQISFPSFGENQKTKNAMWSMRSEVHVSKTALMIFFKFNIYTLQKKIIETFKKCFI